MRLVRIGEIIMETKSVEKASDEKRRTIGEREMSEKTNKHIGEMQEETAREIKR